MVGHPQMLLDAFASFRFRDFTVNEGNVPQITDADKRKILSENYLRMSGVDLDARLRAIANDEFAQRRRELKAHPAPYSTTRVPEFA